MPVFYHVYRLRHIINAMVFQGLPGSIKGILVNQQIRAMNQCWVNIRPTYKIVGQH